MIFINRYRSSFGSSSPLQEQMLGGWVTGSSTDWQVRFVGRALWRVTRINRVFTVSAKWTIRLGARSRSRDRGRCNGRDGQGDGEGAEREGRRISERPRKGRETARARAKERGGKRQAKKKSDKRKAGGEPRTEGAGGGTETGRKKEDLPTSCEPGTWEKGRLGACIVRSINKRSSKRNIQVWTLVYSWPIGMSLRPLLEDVAPSTTFDLCDLSRYIVNCIASETRSESSGGLGDSYWKSRHGVAVNGGGPRATDWQVLGFRFQVHESIEPAPLRRGACNVVLTRKVSGFINETGARVCQGSLAPRIAMHERLERSAWHVGDRRSAVSFPRENTTKIHEPRDREKQDETRRSWTFMCESWVIYEIERLVIFVKIVIVIRRGHVVC